EPEDGQDEVREPVRQQWRLSDAAHILRWYRVEPAAARERRDVVLLLRDRQRAVELARGPGRADVDVVRVDVRCDAIVRQVTGQRGDVSLGLAVGAGELADREVIPETGHRLGPQEVEVPFPQDEGDGFRR